MTALALFAADNPARIDNDQARILVVSSAPEVKSSLHKHDMNRVMIYLDAGKMTLTDPNGKVETLNFKAGEALWSPAGGLHTSLNVSGHAVRIVEVELKSRPGGASTWKQPALDPVKVDPKRYKMEWDVNGGRKVRRGHWDDMALEKCGASLVEKGACTPTWKSGVRFADGC